MPDPREHEFTEGHENRRKFEHRDDFEFWVALVTVDGDKFFRHEYYRECDSMALSSSNV